MPHTCKQTHPVKQHPHLQELILAWQSVTYRDNPLQAIMPITWIMTDAQIKIIVDAKPTKISSSLAVTQLLGKTTGWAE